MSFEKSLLEMIENTEIDKDVRKAVKKGILYEENMTLCSPIILQYIVHICNMQFGKEASKHDAVYQSYDALDNSIISKQLKIADKLASLLHQSAFINYLSYEVSYCDYRIFLSAWARYAPDKEIVKIVNYYKKWKCKKTKDKYRAEGIHDMLLLSDTIAAMKFFDSIGELRKYAQKRGMTESELRSSTMLPDFGFDADGVKRFEIGGNVIEAKVTDALKIAVRYKQTKGYPFFPKEKR